MKYCSRSQTYKASNVTFNAETQVATSYGWWDITRKVRNVFIFNNYLYSNTTRKHQFKVRRLLAELGINIDFEFEVPSGLQNLNWTKSAIKHYEFEISKLKSEIAKPNSRKLKNVERFAKIQELERKIEQVKSFIGTEVL